MNKHIFECEKQIYLAEGVDIDAGGIDFLDNEEIITMLTKVRKMTNFDVHKTFIVREKTFSFYLSWVFYQMKRKDLKDSLLAFKPWEMSHSVNILLLL